MAIKREIKWAVAADGAVTPTTPLDGGAQGDHNQVRAIFEVAEGAAWADPANAVYIECVDGAGNVDTTEQLSVVDGQVAYLLPRAWTQYGGTVTLRLVAEGPGVGDVQAYTSEALARLDSRQNAMDKVDSLLKGRMAETEQRANDALSAAEGAISAAQESVKRAEGYVQGCYSNSNAAKGWAQNAEAAATAAGNAATAAMKAAEEASAADQSATASANDAKQALSLCNKHSSSAEAAATAAGNAATAAEAAAKRAEAAGGGSDITVDGALSLTSENPVQNKIVAEKFNELDGILNGTTTEVTPEPDPVETVSVKNVVTNSNFANGISGWTMVNGGGIDVTVTDGVACYTATAPENKLYQVRTPNLKSAIGSAVGHQLYFVAKVKYEGKLPPTAGCKLSAIEGTGMSTLESTEPILGEWCYMSSISKLLQAVSSSIYTLVSNNYGTTSYVGAKCYVDYVMCIDLTATFGGGNEPDIATMDRWIAEQYSDGFTGTVTLALTAEDDGEDDEPIVEATPGLVEKVATLETDVAGLTTEVADLAEAMENLSDAEVQQTGTVYPTLNEHFIANIEAAKPVYYGKQDANTLTFAMLADMHLLANNKTILPNVEASSAWAKLVNHDFVMMGGDFIIGDESKAASLGYIDTLMEMAEKHADCPVYAVKGNHDSCDGTDNKADRITAKEFYLHANARGEKYGMVTDPEHPYAGYYYVDFPRQKIRMVCLNTTEIKEDVDILTCTNSQLVWAGIKSTYQVEWVRDVALRVPEGWAVMMVSHIPPITGADLGVTDTGDYADTGAPFHNRGIKSPAIVALCKAFAEGTSGTANVTESGSVKIDYDFTEQGAREFIGHFCGHVHEDSLSVYNGMNYVVVNSTTPTKRWATSLDRTASTDKLSLNSFIINRATRTVECIKIGASPAEGNAWWADSFTW